MWYTIMWCLFNLLGDKALTIYKRAHANHNNNMQQNNQNGVGSELPPVLWRKNSTFLHQDLGMPPRSKLNVKNF